MYYEVDCDQKNVVFLSKHSIIVGGIGQSYTTSSLPCTLFFNENKYVCYEEVNVSTSVIMKSDYNSNLQVFQNTTKVR